jgi:hypothetical protein
VVSHRCCEIVRRSAKIASTKAARSAGFSILKVALDLKASLLPRIAPAGHFPRGTTESH